MLSPSKRVDDRSARATARETAPSLGLSPTHTPAICPPSDGVRSGVTYRIRPTLAEPGAPQIHSRVIEPLAPAVPDCCRAIGSRPLIGPSDQTTPPPQPIALQGLDRGPWVGVAARRRAEPALAGWDRGCSVTFWWFAAL